MNKIVWFMSISIDGFMEGPGHDITWHLVDEEVHAHSNAALKPAGVYIEGRVSHELMTDYWPTADEEPGASPTTVEYARMWKAVPKYVLSRTRTEFDWSEGVLSEIDPDAIRALAARYDGDLVVGGASVASQFLALDLIDVLHLNIHPIVLGGGTPMFQAPDVTKSFTLEHSHVFGNGVVHLRYGR